MQTSEAAKDEPPRETDCGSIGSVEPVSPRRRPCRHREVDDTMSGLPEVGEGGMSGRNVQRKLGTTRGSPRRSRTAKASRISRHAVKMRCAHEWDGWGRLSNDGLRQHNSGKSEDPWGRSGDSTSWRCTIESASRRSAGQPLDHEVHEGWKQTGRHAANVGSRLKRAWKSGRRHLKSLPSSRTGENPPYGMIGGIEETSASFEARSAPRSYPTALVYPEYRTSVCYSP